MKIVIFSDIHSNFDALAAVLNDVEDYDMLICLGDLVGYGAQPNEVVETVRTLKPQMLIAGNHDYAVVTEDVSGFVWHAVKAIKWTREVLREENLQYLSNLPHFSNVKLEELKVGAYHGSPREPLDEYIFPGMPEFTLKSLLELAKADILLLGHTHVPFHFNFNSKLILNPGSVGQPRDGDPRASYAVLEVKGNNVSHNLQRVEYNIDLAASKIVQSGLPSFLADRLYCGI
ncbi:MAG: metallophosphoesterase family protein [Candidatus Brockarchaeota archaeon]|nr:metallophosphoesterase family protein [Candidatus Brockarchaeota archaeon]